MKASPPPEPRTGSRGSRRGTEGGDAERPFLLPFPCRRRFPPKAGARRRFFGCFRRPLAYFRAAAQSEVRRFPLCRPRSPFWAPGEPPAGRRAGPGPGGVRCGRRFGPSRPEAAGVASSGPSRKRRGGGRAAQVSGAADQRFPSCPPVAGLIGMLGSGFKAERLRVNLRLVINRLKLLEKKKSKRRRI